MARFTIAMATISAQPAFISICPRGVTTCSRYSSCSSGASGAIALETTARAVPDGYTMVIFGVNQIISAELTNPTNDMFRDFAPVSQVAAAPYASAGRSAYARNVFRRRMVCRTGSLSRSRSHPTNDPHHARANF